MLCFLITNSITPINMESNMNMNNRMNLEYTLIRCFSNKATPEQEMFVQQWVSQNPDNIFYYQKIQRLWIQRIDL
jgi:hypothetical protein